MNRRNSLGFVISTGFIASLTGCATATGPEFSQLQPINSGEGNLYIYRKSALYAAAAAYKVWDENKKEIASLVNASYIVLPLKPGKYTFSVFEGFGSAKSFEVQVESGKDYFVEYDSSKGLLLGWGLLSNAGTRSVDQALQDLKGLKRNN